MGRRKIEIRAIKDDRNRSVTFLKRKGGLFKKAHELSVLCSVDVAVIIFGHNKKLYEFSSGDINETLRRYQYYGQPHEHKGPADFKNKGGEDDDEEDDDEDMAHGREDSMPPQPSQMLPPHLQHHESFSHLRQQAPSASPPMQNGMFQPRHGTPQPQIGSRPNSRNTIRRTSSNLIPMQHPHATPPPPPQNGFAYMPNPPIYNAQAPPPPQPSPQPPYQPFPQHVAPQHQAPHPPPQPQVQNAHQAFLEDQRRHSQPQLPRHDGLQPPQIPVSRASPQPEHQSLRPPDQLSPPQPKHLPSKSRSIFTPIDDGGSILAQHFMLGNSSRNTNNGSSSNNNSHTIKQEGLFENRHPPRSVTAPVHPRSARQPSDPPVPEFPPPSRSNTNSSKSGAPRPRLKVQIPSEASDGESAAGSPQPSVASGTVAKNSTDSHHSGGIVLPPPSPSASAVLSAGASGPPNPFARPAPPGSNPSNTSSYMENRNSVETPMSALPSRFMNENLLPSPSSFYPEWGFGRTGPDSALLPSPLPFPTPIQPTAPNSFTRGDLENGGEKRRHEEDQARDVKKLKT